VGLTPDEVRKMEALENPYQAAIRKTLKFLDYYDTDGFIPFFGYGAKLPPFKNSVSHCFAVNGNIFKPDVKGINSMIKNYVKCIDSVDLHGPNALEPIIRYAITVSSEEKIS
jgi:hypothetical protein